LAASAVRAVREAALLAQALPDLERMQAVGDLALVPLLASLLVPAPLRVRTELAQGQGLADPLPRLVLADLRAALPVGAALPAEEGSVEAVNQRSR
jgi:hypothetical protein